MAGWRGNVFYGYEWPREADRIAPLRRAAEPIADVYRLTSFLDAVVAGTLDDALRMAGTRGSSPPDAKDASAASSTATDMPTGWDNAATSPLGVWTSVKPADQAGAVSKLSPLARANLFRTVVANDARVTAAAQDTLAALELALLERGFAIDADIARLAVLRVASGRSPYSLGDDRQWLRVHASYGIVRDLQKAVESGLALDAATKSALAGIAHKLKASGWPTEKEAKVRLRQTMLRLEALSGTCRKDPAALPPGLRAGFGLDLYEPAVHAFLDAVLERIAALRPDTGQRWLTADAARRVRACAEPLARRLPYLWDRDRLPEARLFAFDGADTTGRLLSHLRSLSAVRPTRRWLAKVTTLAAGIGADRVRDGLMTWTGLLLRTTADIGDWGPIHQANALHRSMLWARLPEAVAALDLAGADAPGSRGYGAAVDKVAQVAIAGPLLLDHIDEAGPCGFNDLRTPFLPIGLDCLPAVKGAIWALSQWPDDEVARHLEAIALAMLEKRHGEFRSLAAANAAIGALGAVGTPVALAALSRIRKSVSDRSIAAVTARALTRRRACAGKVIQLKPST